ncbi:MAG: T9SS type A sorting domain-containing protein, partial [Bacteroidota bacterium]
TPVITNNTVGATTIITCTTPTITVTASGGTGYAWSGGATPATAANSFTAAGTFVVTVTAANGCTATSSITVTQNTTPPIAGITNNTGTTLLTCATPTINVTATGGTGYIWSNGGTTAAKSFTLPGNYTVTVTGANGCNAISSISITQDITAPTVNTVPNVSYCNGNTASSIAFSISTTGGTVSYSWSSTVNVGFGTSGIGNIPTFTATNTGGTPAIATVSVTATRNGCVGTPSTFTVTVNPILPVSVVIAANQNPTCPGTSITFTATPTNGGSSPVYQWFKNGSSIVNNSATYAFSPANGDQVYVMMTSNATCINGNPATSNIVTMIINNNLPASVTVTPSAFPSCPGANVTYTATPVNGGTAPTYQWHKNGFNIGTNSPIFNDLPATGDQVNVTMTSNLLCAYNNPATSDFVNMIVNPNIPASVSIVSSASSVCAGVSATFTATTVNGGTSPIYQWYVNGLSVGTNNSTYSYTPINGDQIKVAMVSNAICATGSPATSNTIVMTVNPILAASVSISASANNVCAGTSVNYTATVVNGGTSPSYQWYKNNVAFGFGSTLSYVPANNDAIYLVMTSNANCVTGSPATSNTISMQVNPLMPVSVSVAASATTVCAGTTVTYTATPGNPGSAPSYQWYVNTLAISNNSPVYSYSPANGDHVYVVLTSNALCAAGSPATSNTVIMTVNPLLTAGVSIVASANPVCAGTSVTFTATPSNGGTPSYQWFVNGLMTGTNSASFTYTPINSDVVRVQMTSTVPCVLGSPSNSNIIYMQVNPILPASVSISSSATVVCAGTSVTVQAAASNGGTTAVYQWYKNNVPMGTNSSSFTFTPANGDAVYVKMTSNAVCVSGSPATSNTVSITVNPVLVASVSILASANQVCEGTLVTYNATSVNGGSAPSYQWYLNGIAIGFNNPALTLIPLNGDEVKVKMTSNAICVTASPATSNTVTMIVYPLMTASVQISTPTNPACAGSMITFTATPTNGGPSPAYQWYKNNIPVSGNNSPSYSIIPNNWDMVYVVMTSNANCIINGPASSNTIMMNMTTPAYTSVSITADQNPVCGSTLVTLTATAVNGGTSPTYQWFINGVAFGTNSNTYAYIPSNGDNIFVTMSSSASCVIASTATSAVLVMSVNSSLSASVSVAASTNPVCDGSNVTFTANPIGGGSSPIYQWYKNGAGVGANNPVYSYMPTNGDAIKVVMTSNASCASGSPATSNTVIMNVNATSIASVNISASANSVCAGTTVSYTAVPSHGGTNPVYQWYRNAVAVGVNSATFSYAPANGDVIQVVMTSNALCVTGNPATSNAISMTVNPVMVASVSMTANKNPVCPGTVVIFTATPVNGGSTPVYQWIKNGAPVGSNSPTYSYIPLNGDIVHVELISNVNCVAGSPATSNPILMSVTTTITASVSIAASANPVTEGTSVTFTATPTNGGTNPAYQWYVNGAVVASTTDTYSYVPSNGDLVNVVMTSNEACASGSPVTSGTLTMTVLPGTFTVSGHVRYANIILSPLGNTNVTLSVNGTVAYATTANVLGFYSFTGVLPGAYVISGSSTATWGGVNATDGLLIQRHFVQMSMLSGIYLRAADVNKSNYVNTGDAVLAVRRYVGYVNSFPAGDWLFDSANIAVSNTNVSYDFLGICFGDVNGSYQSSPGKADPDVRLETRGQLEVETNASFEIPLMTARELQAGAISLAMNFPSDLIDIQNVIVAGDPGNVQFKANDGELRVGWYSENAINFDAGNAILKLVVRLRDPHANLQSIKFSLEGADCQLANAVSDVNHDVRLIIPELISRNSIAGITLLENIPNPVNNKTMFSFITAEEGNVSITLFNASGEKVDVIASNIKVAKALNTIDYDASKLAQGIYYYRFDFTGTQHSQQLSRKMVVVR